MLIEKPRRARAPWMRLRMISLSKCAMGRYLRIASSRAMAYSASSPISAVTISMISPEIPFPRSSVAITRLESFLLRWRDWLQERANSSSLITPCSCRRKRTALAISSATPRRLRWVKSSPLLFARGASAISAIV